jgi:hydroxymethylpyrimidine/phosphomethylpyrimidine kinase
MVSIALTIAGSDSSGGAGIQADLATFSAFKVYGASVLTALTAQNTTGVRAIFEVSPQFVAQQLDAVLDDLDVAAAKTGMLARAVIIEELSERLRVRPVPYVVVDPVMVATSGDLLLDPAATAAMRERMLPLATLVTPNLREAEVLTGRAVSTVAEMRDAARALVDLGAGAALVKGGHLAGEATDVFFDGRRLREFSAARIATRNTHGTGCTLSAAVTAGLAIGHGLETAIANAKSYVTRAIELAPDIGHGHGPVNHFVPIDEEVKQR